MVGLGTWYFVFLERENDCNQKWPKVTNGKITIRKANRIASTVYHARNKIIK
jgi:hypothetical protein